MFLTHTPCGDASIFPKLFEETLSSAVADELETDVAIKKRKIVSDIHRTGAKCVPTGEQDAHLGGVDYHTVGMFRIKPGRGTEFTEISKMYTVLGQICLIYRRSDIVDVLH